MVRDRLNDGVRIAQLLASEIVGNRGRLRALDVTDADPDVDPTADGALAYAVVRESATGTDASAETAFDRVAEAYVQPDRVRVEFLVAVEAVAAAADAADLRVRPKAVRPPRTLVFLEDGAAVKRILSVLETV